MKNGSRYSGFKFTVHRCTDFFLLHSRFFVFFFCPKELSSGTSAAGGTVSELQTNTSQLGREPNEPVSWTAILGVFAAVVACTWAVLALIL